MINPKKKKRPYLDYDLEGYIKGQQTARTDATSNLQATTLRLVAENNTSEKVLLRRVANERRKTLEAYEKGKRDYERQLQAAKVLGDIELRPWWNPTAVLRNAKNIPIFGAAPTATEWAYGLMNKAVGNDATGDYYMLDADNSATGQAIALAAIPAHTNPYTAAMYDTALLAPWMKELDALGKFYHPETLTREEAAMLGLSVLPFGLKYKPLLSYAKTAAEDVALQSSIPWVRDNARGLYLSRAINQAADLGVYAPIKVDRSIERDGTIRMSLPSHTSEQPRQFVIDPLGNNKYYIHMRTWDGKKVPANLSAAEKNALFESVYNELPEGAEILFPKSSEDYLATRGTVAGLQRLSRDKRFSPGQEGTLLYYDDKTGQTKTYSGTSFIKNPQLSATLYVIENSEPVNVPTINWQQATAPQKLTRHLQGEEAVKMFKEYGGELIPEGSINGELIRKYVPEARERYGLIGNNNITDEEIALALYKHSKELGEGTAAVNALGEPLLLFRGDTRPYTELKTNHLESGGTEDNILGTLFLDRTGIGEGLGPDRYLYIANRYGEVMAPYHTGTETEKYSLLSPYFKDGYLYNYPEGKGGVALNQFSYPYWEYNLRRGKVEGHKILSDSFKDGTVNQLNAFIVRTPSVRDITNEVVVTGGKPGTPPKPFEWLIPKEERIGSNLHDVRIALNKAVLQEAEKNKLGLLKSDRDSYWRGEEHEDYDYFALPDFNALNAKHLLPYDLRIPRDWNDRNIYRSLSIPISIGGGYTLYNILNNNNLLIQTQKVGGKILPPWHKY